MNEQAYVQAVESILSPAVDTCMRERPTDPKRFFAEYFARDAPPALEAMEMTAASAISKSAVLGAASSVPLSASTKAALAALPKSVQDELAAALAATAQVPAAVLLPPHFGPEALLESVASGAIAPLRGRWVVALQAGGGTLSRRQELPPEAFWKVEDLRRVVAALGEDYALLFVALSYRWLTKEHPDPKGFHLEIVAAVARLYMKAEKMYGMSCSPLAAAFEKAGLGEPDFALFWE